MPIEWKGELTFDNAQSTWKKISLMPKLWPITITLLTELVATAFLLPLSQRSFVQHLISMFLFSFGDLLIDNALYLMLIFSNFELGNHYSWRHA
jgi:hypothetical protein